MYTYPQSDGQRRMHGIELLLSVIYMLTKLFLKCGINLIKHSFAGHLKRRNN